MKRSIAGATIILFLITLCWGAQGTKSPFDAKKSREELEIMKGILGTTLSFVLNNSKSQPEASSWRYSNINAFYLSGQGAVFVIPSSILRGFGGGSFNFNFNFGDLSESLAALNSDVAAISSQAAQQAFASGYVQNALRNAGKSSDNAPAQPASPAPPAPPNPPQINSEELHKKIEAYQEKAKKARETADANRQKFLQKLGEAKGFLVETLANYGDSLTTVDPNEYVNLVLLTDNSNQEIISAKKAWITDYKAGRLTMSAFKQKVLQYSE